MTDQPVRKTCLSRIRAITLIALLPACGASGQVATQPVAMTVTAPKQVTGQAAVPVRVTLTNVSRRPISTMPLRSPWPQKLMMGQRVLRLIPIEQAPAVAARTLDLGLLEDVEVVDLAPGKSVSLDVQLRQVLDLAKAEGAYRLDFRWYSYSTTAQVSFVRDKRPRKLLGSFKAVMQDSSLYRTMWPGSRQPPRIELSRVLDGDRTLILAGTNFTLDPGEIQLAVLPKPTTPVQLVHAHSSIRELPKAASRPKPKQPLRRGEVPPTPPDPPVLETEYVAAAWLDGNRVMYTTFGAHVYPIGMTRTPPKALQTVPAFRCLVGDGPVVLAKNVRQITQARADADGRIRLTVVDTDGNRRVIIVNERGVVTAK